MSFAVLESSAPISRPLMSQFHVDQQRLTTVDTARQHRLARCQKVICIRRSLAADTYENDLKLSIALDRLMDELELA